MAYTLEAGDPPCPSQLITITINATIKWYNGYEPSILIGDLGESSDDFKDNSESDHMVVGETDDVDKEPEKPNDK